MILQSLKEHGWNRNATAESLGINRTTLYKMKRLGLECPAGAF
ncbi:MAG: helix-turn-helix domain-containing protein [Pirellulaceae bacterium]